MNTVDDARTAKRSRVLPSFRRSLESLVTRSNIVLALAALVLLAAVLQVGYDQVRGDSMAPTLRDSQYVVIERLSYRFSQPDRGDMLVVHLRPDDWFLASSTGGLYLKRVVGLPGDTVEVRDGQVYVNGLQLEKTHATTGTPRAVAPVRVPEGSYYLLGDNYGSSTDSRSWGPVPADRIAGRVWFALW